MGEEQELIVGTLIRDMGRIGIVTKIIKSGSLDTVPALIKWRINYEIVYSDGTITIIARESFRRLRQAGIIEIL